jgi:hypothetical protein
MRGLSEARTIDATMAYYAADAVYGYVFVWSDGKAQRATPYRDAHEARADAERLAKERR